MRLALLAIGGDKEPWLAELRDSYQEKIGRFIPFEIVSLKATSLDRENAQKKKAAESEAILKKIASDDFLILFDEKGKESDSIAFSKNLVRAVESGKKRVVLVIGGAFGFSDSLRNRAQASWSLSRLTFNHHLAQAIALEQIYRAITIWKGIPYHNG